MQLWIIGVLCISALRTYVPTVEANPLGVGFASFPEGIRDWFRSMKNRLLGGSDPQALPPMEAGKMIMELENKDPQEQRRSNPGGFFLNLTNLTFNPDRDWGFRLGQWYFIRKPNDEPAPKDWKSSNYPEWPPMDEGQSDNMAPPLVTVKSIDVTTTAASTPGTEALEVTEPTVTAEPKDADNETHISSESIQSAEVLLPAK